MSNGKKEKLERRSGVEATEYTMKAARGDEIELWHPRYMDTWNLSLKDERGENVVTIYGLTERQLASLYALIGQRLGLPSSVTVEHLRQLQQHLREVFPEPMPMPFGGGEETP